MKLLQTSSQVTCGYVLHKQEQKTPLHCGFFKWFCSKWPMNHKKEVISHHSLPWLPQDCQDASYLGLLFICQCLHLY